MPDLLFKTNLTHATGVDRLATRLRQLGVVSWSLNLADENHLLRVTVQHVAPALLLTALRQAGIDCQPFNFSIK